MEIKILLFIYSIAFLLALSYISGKEEEIRIDESVFEEIVNSKKVNNYYTDIAALENSTDLTYLAYYYKKSSDNSKFGAYYLKRIDRRLDHLAVILLIDCDRVIPRDISHCAGEDFPKIKLLVPPLYKFDPKTKKMNGHQLLDFTESIVSEETLYKFVTDNIPSFTTKLGSETIETFLNQPVFNKVILFTNKETTPKIYKGLSNIYYDRILFGLVPSQEEELVQKFEITSFPSIIVVENPFLLKDDYITHRFEGEVDVREISHFIEKFALREKNYVRRLSFLKFDKTPFSKITTRNYELFFDRQETKLNSKIVYFSKEEINKIPEDLKKFAELTTGYFNFGLMNCKGVEKFCKEELFIDVDNLPGLYLFKPHPEPLKNNFLLPTSYTKLVNYFSQRIIGNVKRVNESAALYDHISEDRAHLKYPIAYIHKVNQFI